MRELCALFFYWAHTGIYRRIKKANICDRSATGVFLRGIVASATTGTTNVIILGVSVGKPAAVDGDGK